MLIFLRPELKCPRICNNIQNETASNMYESIDFNSLAPEYLSSYSQKAQLKIH